MRREPPIAAENTTTLTLKSSAGSSIEGSMPIPSEKKYIPCEAYITEDAIGDIIARTMKVITRVTAVQEKTASV